jgi:hypothetical protein
VFNVAPYFLSADFFVKESGEEYSSMIPAIDPLRLFEGVLLLVQKSAFKIPSSARIAEDGKRPEKDGERSLPASHAYRDGKRNARGERPTHAEMSMRKGKKALQRFEYLHRYQTHSRAAPKRRQRFGRLWPNVLNFAWFASAAFPTSTKQITMCRILQCGRKSS